MKLNRIIKTLVLILSLNLLASVSYANLACVKNGDFSPFPWSDQHTTRIADFEWPLINPQNKVESKIVIEQIDLYVTKLPILLIREYALNGNLISLGTAWGDQEAKSLTFRTSNISQLNKGGSYTKVQFGIWRSKGVSQPDGHPMPVPYSNPLQDLGFSPMLLPEQCTEFISPFQGELFGLIVEKDRGDGSEFKDIYFSFEPIN